LGVELKKSFKKILKISPKFLYNNVLSFFKKWSKEAAARISSNTSWKNLRVEIDGGILPSNSEQIQRN
jgi:hypothetical protein